MLMSLMILFLTASPATIAAPIGGSMSVTNLAALYSQAETNTTVQILPRGAPCSATSPCTGSITHWGGGLGACGLDVNTEVEHAVALPVGIMGPLSNSNPLCGKSVAVRHGVTGKMATGVVRDKCMECVGGDLDLTDRLFEVVTDGQGDGRVGGCSWWFR